QQPRSVRTVRRPGQRAEGRAMSTTPSPRRRLRIGRLDLDMRGVDADRAEAAARALGRALAAAITPRQALGVARERIDAGRVELAAAAGARHVAAAGARRTADVLERKKR